MSTKPKKYIIQLDLNDDFSLKNNVSFIRHALIGNNLDFPYLDVSVYFINFILRNNTLAVSFDDVEAEFIKQSDGLIDLYEESFTYYDSKDDGGENYIVNASFGEFLNKVLIIIKMHFDSLIRMVGIIQSYMKWPVNLYKIKILYSDSRRKGTNTLTKIASGILLYLEDYISEEINEKSSYSEEFITKVYNKGKDNIAADKPPIEIKTDRPTVTIRLNGKTYEIPTEQYLGDTKVKELKNLPFSVEEIQQKLKELFPELNLDVKRGNSLFAKKPFLADTSKYLDAISDQLEVKKQEELEKPIVDNLNLSSLEFNTPRDRIIFGLTKLKGEERLRFLGIKKEHLGDRMKNYKWLSYAMDTLDHRDTEDSCKAFDIIWDIHEAMRRGIWPTAVTGSTF